jgi:signal-transduction protein with cAMP-binding, CBS, and nucleotidyltransferase domain
MASIQQRVVRNLVSLDQSASCAEAARRMAEQGVGSVAVLRGGRVVGLVTERDLVAGLVARGATAGDPPIAAVMRTDLPAVSPRASDRECAHLMRTLRTRHLPVAEMGEIVGVISMLDLVDLVVEEKQSEIESLESYIRGGRAQGLSQPTTTTIFTH